MYTLYHYQLCPSSRFIRLLLNEYRLEYTTQLENYWSPQEDFLMINPAGHLPVLIDKTNFPIVGPNACMEYVKDLELKPSFFFDDYRIKAETNRLFHWFETLFRKEVLEPLIYEKVFSRIVDNLIPNSENIRNALQNMTFHTKYLEYLLKNNDYLIKDKITVIDLLAAANFSVLDYLGLFNLGDNIILKEWYLKIKSRPSFKSLLQDHIIGLNPHENYKFVDI